MTDRCLKCKAPIIIKLAEGAEDTLENEIRLEPLGETMFTFEEDVAYEVIAYRKHACPPHTGETGNGKDHIETVEEDK